MISTPRIIYCINPNCEQPINTVGNVVCASCQTPVVYRYLWATGKLVATIPLGTKVADRYEAIAPQIWLDTQPGLPPDIQEELPPIVIPYLRLYSEHLHLPQVYGLVASGEADTDDILLLENVPIDEHGNLYPSLTATWEQAKAVRQVYWLWQILQLWTPLSELGLAQSLLIPDNLRVQGWCVRLLELDTTATEQPSLADLAHGWQPLVDAAKTAAELKPIIELMTKSDVELDTIATQLNALLLSTAAELPLNLKVVGATDTGPQLQQNEDACYPNTTDNADDSLLPHLSIVCDGIGGHQGGEVASQLAVQSLKLQIRALLAEITEQTEIVPPKLLQEQLEACLRVVNNVISSRNDEQKRQGRERMATTLVMAVQVPQRVLKKSGWQSNAHELYLASVGDSRAYWITRNYCQQLTVDDDVVAREVRLARSLYRQALQRPDAHALTQALGTRDAEALRLVIQRFILEEDGILLLCSDGLSDRNLVEEYWQNYAMSMLTGNLTVEDAVREWINLANEKNGHDNTSVVLTLCRIAKESLVPMPPPPPLVAIPKLEPPEPEISALAEIETQSSLAEIETQSSLAEIEQSTLTESSQALLDLDLTVDEPSPTPFQQPTRQRQPLVLIGGLLALLVGGTGVGLFAWWQLNPQTFQQMCRKLPPSIQPVCPPRQ
ncbi:serine/threonine protein phosphatase [Nostoc sp. PCC 7524]|uniref:PP2C family protein-serine/threonine phosphatase n=1 Tax=Nostoc sp. (strain ATCC 29411 / PCC 7524) TaxID=28072 RepID=UPI00029EE23F|nr:protein phosphatase 2C domain-containing protein [Nostoc sp. PCC 7524]AFY45973.1 serine/threonine protein phosphatase [Nostoc sp. PCC 7524]